MAINLISKKCMKCKEMLSMKEKNPRNQFIFKEQFNYLLFNWSVLFCTRIKILMFGGPSQINLVANLYLNTECCSTPSGCSRKSPRHDFLLSQHGTLVSLTVHPVSITLTWRPYSSISHTDKWRQNYCRAHDTTDLWTHPRTYNSVPCSAHTWITDVTQATWQQTLPIILYSKYCQNLFIIINKSSSTEIFNR